VVDEPVILLFTNNERAREFESMKDKDVSAIPDCIPTCLSDPTGSLSRIQVIARCLGVLSHHWGKDPQQ
jgi:hypothetical protein